MTASTAWSPSGAARRRHGQGRGFFTEQEQGAPGTSFADRPALPHVAITTTYSGAELTPFFGMTDPATHRKQGAAAAATTAPLAALYDPMLAAVDTRRG